MIENQSCNILVKDKTWQNQKSANLMKGDIWGNIKLEKAGWLKKKTLARLNTPSFRLARFQRRSFLLSRSKYEAKYFSKTIHIILANYL